MSGSPLLFKCYMNDIAFVLNLCRIGAGNIVLKHSIFYFSVQFLRYRVSSGGKNILRVEIDVTIVAITVNPFTRTSTYPYI